MYGRRRLTLGDGGRTVGEGGEIHRSTVGFGG